MNEAVTTGNTPAVDAPRPAVASTPPSATADADRAYVHRARAALLGDG